MKQLVKARECDLRHSPSVQRDLCVHAAPRLLAIAFDFSCGIKGQNSSFICLCSHCGISPNLTALALSNPCCGPDPLRAPRLQLGIAKLAPMRRRLAVTHSPGRLSIRGLKTQHESQDCSERVTNILYVPRIISIGHSIIRKTADKDDGKCYLSIRFFINIIKSFKCQLYFLFGKEKENSWPWQNSICYNRFVIQIRNMKSIAQGNVISLNT